MRRPLSVLGCFLDPVEEVGDRGMLAKLISMLDNSLRFTLSPNANSICTCACVSHFYICNHVQPDVGQIEEHIILPQPEGCIRLHITLKM